MDSVFAKSVRDLTQAGLLPVLWSLLLFCANSLYAQDTLDSSGTFLPGVPAGEKFSASPGQSPTEYDPIVIACEFLHEETPSAVDISARLAADSSTSAPFVDGAARVFILRDRCRIRQGGWELKARQMVIWRSTVQRNGRTVEKLLVYPEGGEVVASTGGEASRPQSFIELYSSVGVTVEARHSDPGHVANGDLDPLHKRALQAKAKLQETPQAPQVLMPPGQAKPLLQSDIDFDSLAPAVATGGGRHIVISPRSFGVGYNVSSFLSHQTSPPEQITTISQGVNIVIEGVSEVNGVSVGALDLSADRVVIWTQADASGKFNPEMFQSRDAPLQIYLEGNIEIRQGQNVLKAAKAYYDIREDRAVLHEGELRVKVPDMEGDIKLRAEKIRQLSHQSFHAENAWVTGSEFGVPTYRMEAGDIFLENRYDRGWLGKGDTTVDPETGMAVPKATPWITSLNNQFRVYDTPIFVSPFMSGPAEDPHIPLESLTFGGDGIFGAQAKTVWNLSKLLGVSLPGTDWNLQAHAYSERGFWLGTDATYSSGTPLGTPGSYFGLNEAVWINDMGTDNLGLDRRDLDISNNTRGRVLWRHRQYFTDELNMVAEIGLLSDRNFLEQYYENEWDQGKDNETLIGMNYTEGNAEASILASGRLNDFSYDTQWLPKADLTFLGEPLLWDRLVYSSRTSAGYGQLRPAAAPEDPNDLFIPTWYYPEAEGAVFSTRHELSMPFSLGGLKLDPYVMGEAAYWQDDGFTNNSMNRFYGSAGLRGSMQLWKVFPEVRSQILGLNGLAHKQTLGFDYYFADSTQDLNDVPQYNQFEDNAQERFRTRLIFNTFGLNNSALLNPAYDPRVYAVRSGAARNVSSPYFELVDDQQVLRLNWSHRLQTKVGPPERQRVKDWMTLDLGLSYFPDAGDDNFGESFGLATANYMWDLGSRTKLLANGQFDFFEDAPQVWDVGFLNQRSTRGSLYVGYRNIQAGDLESQLLTGSVSYAMSEKWIATLGTAYDIAENQDRGQSLTITGIRADFLIHVGLSVDSSKGNFGVGFMIEPRLGPMNAGSSRLSSLLGTQ